MKDKKFKFIIIVFVVCGCLYILGSRTFSSYESNVTATMEANVSGVSVKINGTDLTTYDKESLVIDSISWEAPHTRSGKIAPGAVGSVTLELDPTGTEVAMKYTFKLVDKQIDEEKLLKFDSFTSDLGDLVRTGENEYTGIFTVDDLENNIKANISMNFEFEDDDIIGTDTNTLELDDYFTIEFNAIQYTGEAIVPYNGG